VTILYSIFLFLRYLMLIFLLQKVLAKEKGFKKIFGAVPDNALECYKGIDEKESNK